MEADELFEPGSPLAARVRGAADPVAAAWSEIERLTEAEAMATLNAHPRIGATRNLSEHSSREQGTEADPGVLARLELLNDDYERRFGFRFVVFVNGRSRAEIADVLQQRLGRPRELELREGLEDIVRIAEDRQRR